MNRNEAVLRELNLYPQWVRRNQPVPVVADIGLISTRQPVGLKPDLQSCATTTVGEIHELPEQTGAIKTERAIDETTSHPTRLSKNNNQVAGYREAPLYWPELKQQVRDCTACGLRAGCTQTVFGTGDETADWLFVGEGPGADEDARGEPFVGEAGKLLDNMLLAIKLKRGKNVYIANIVKCRPPDGLTPKADEIAACLPYLQRQIELIKPKLIIALGKTAATALLKKDATIDSLRGMLHDFNGIPLVVTYHPAYLLRKPSEKAKAWQDLCLAVNTMAG